MSDESKGFTIKDRRISATQDENEAAGEAKEEQPGNGQAGPTKTEEAAARAEYAEEQPSHFPKIDFSTFVFSLNSSALVHLGLLEDPASGAKAKNLDLARQTIDILGMLEEKTRGNLNSDEEQMLKNILYDLRILYVKEKS